MENWFVIASIWISFCGNTVVFGGYIVANTVVDSNG
jgi:hypothetical protein